MPVGFASGALWFLGAFASQRIFDRGTRDQLAYSIAMMVFASLAAVLGMDRRPGNVNHGGIDPDEAGEPQKRVSTEPPNHCGSLQTPQGERSHRMVACYDLGSSRSLRGLLSVLAWKF